MMTSLLLYYALFASALSVNKILLSFISLWFFVALRRLVAGILLFIYHFLYSPRMRFSYIRQDLLKILSISVLTMFVPSILKAYGFKYLVSSKAALLGSLDPLITAVYAYALWGERLTLTKMIGMIISFIGIFILLASTASPETLFSGMSIISLPELAMVGSLIISRYGWILARDVLKSERYSPSELSSLIMITSGIYALIAAYFLNECDFCKIPPTPQVTLLFAYSIFFGEIIGYTIYGNLLKKHNITFISLSGLSIPLFVHLYGPLLLGEPLSLTFFMAFGFFAVGMYIFYYDTTKD